MKAVNRSCTRVQLAHGRVLPKRPTHRMAPCMAPMMKPSAAFDASSAPGLRPERWTGSREQVDALHDLRRRIRALPDSNALDDETLIWFLRDRGFDEVEAGEKLQKVLRWRREFQPHLISRESLAPELATRKAWVHTHKDKYGRPVVMIDAKKHVVGDFPLESSKRMFVLIIEEAISLLPPPSEGASTGTQEQIVGIFDLRGFQVTRNADFQFAAFLVEAFFEFYPKRVGQVLFVEAPWVFLPAWEAVKPLMRKYKSLVSFVTVEEAREGFFAPGEHPAELFPN